MSFTCHIFYLCLEVVVSHGQILDNALVVENQLSISMLSFLRDAESRIAAVEVECPIEVVGLVLYLKRVFPSLRLNISQVPEQALLKGNEWPVIHRIKESKLSGSHVHLKFTCLVFDCQVRNLTLLQLKLITALSQVKVLLVHYCLHSRNLGKQAEAFCFETFHHVLAALFDDPSGAVLDKCNRVSSHLVSSSF